jgi:hypothetical protein
MHRKLAKYAQNNAKQFNWGFAAHELVKVFKAVSHA